MPQFPRPFDYTNRKSSNGSSSTYVSSNSQGVSYTSVGRGLISRPSSPAYYTNSSVSHPPSTSINTPWVHQTNSTSGYTDYYESSNDRQATSTKPSNVSSQYAGYSQFYSQCPISAQNQQSAIHTHARPPMQQYMYPPRASRPPPPRPASYSETVTQKSNSQASVWSTVPASSTTTSKANNPWHWATGRPSNPNTAAASHAPIRFSIGASKAKPVARSYGSTKNSPQQLVPSPAAHVVPVAQSNSSVERRNTNQEWPPSLHQYVQRAFEQCKTEHDKANTQKYLKEVVTNAIMESQLWIKDWKNHPLPSIQSAQTVPQLPETKPSIRENVGKKRQKTRFDKKLAEPLFSFPTGQPMQPVPQGQNSVPQQSFIPLNSSSTLSTPKKKKKRKQVFQAQATGEDIMKRQQRLRRFEKDQPKIAQLNDDSISGVRTILKADGELDLEAMTIKGTCQTIEKEYLRLTSVPRPSTVRPMPVLRNALDLIKDKWKNRKCDYLYVCSQMKSIRQDLTVQHLKNEFTVEVYETHARIAIEEGDMNEFNQCQTQLQELYAANVKGNVIEFLSYRVLYCVYTQDKNKKDSGTIDILFQKMLLFVRFVVWPFNSFMNVPMNAVLGSLNKELRHRPEIEHALGVREAVTLNQYHRFFQLYENAPNMTCYFMDLLANSIRLRALRIICKTYRPSIPLAYIRDLLHLKKGKKSSEFIRNCGIQWVSNDTTLIDTKNSSIVTTLATDSSLI